MQLGAFTVSAEDDRGYYAPSAISGTRTKTELLNLPMNLNVLTEQFIKDIAATDLVDIVSFTAGLAPAPATSGGMRIGYWRSGIRKPRWLAARPTIMAPNPSP